MNDNKTKLPKRDDWANLQTGLAGPGDKAQYGYYARFPTLWETELNNMYEQSAISARIVDRLVDDACRGGFLLEGLDKSFDFSRIKSYLDNIKFEKAVSKAWKQARLYGGALLIMLVNDGRTYDEPLDKENLTNIIGFRVIPSHRALPDSYNYGLGAYTYLCPEYYRIQNLNGDEKRIHFSRCIRFEGIPEIPDQRKMEIHNGWGPSVLQRVYREISALGQAEGYLSNIMHEASLLGVGIDGLYEQLCSEGGPENVRGRLESLKQMMDNLHILALDNTDKFIPIPRDINGIEKIIDKFIDAVVRATNYPRLIILGEQPGGLNNSADGEVRGYYDWVAAEQQNVLTPIYNDFMELVFQIRKNKSLPVPEEWEISYPPLWQPSEQEQADTFLKKMQAAQIATTYGYAKPYEIRSILINEGYIDASLSENPNEKSPLQDREIEIMKDLMISVNAGQMTPAQARALASVAGPNFANQELLMKMFPEATVANPAVLEAPVDEETEVEAAPSVEPVPPDLVSTREAAENVGVPTNTINRMCQQGALRYWQFGSRKQVSLSEVMEAGRPTHPEEESEEDIE